MLSLWRECESAGVTSVVKMGLGKLAEWKNLATNSNNYELFFSLPISPVELSSEMQEVALSTLS